MINSIVNQDLEFLKEEVRKNELPEHIAIIMDGNGRWATNKLLQRTAGHREGVKRVREIVKECGNLGIKYLTLYAFSTENWKRPQDEVGFLMKLLLEFLNKEVNTLHTNNVKINVIGDIDGLDKSIKNKIENAMNITKDNNKLILNIALNYGSRDEIKRAIIKIVDEVLEDNIEKESINEDIIKKYLYTKNQPDPSLLIRTSGELRLSNFLLYQLAYTEFWFTDINWPDFTNIYLYNAILDFQNRKRRFGGV